MGGRNRKIIMQTCNEMGVNILKDVLARDHVHMFMSILPKLSLSDVMQRIKGRSSRRIQMEFIQTSAFSRMSQGCAKMNRGKKCRMRYLSYERRCKPI